MIHRMKVSLVVHDIRSTHNVGAFFRTCDGLGVDEILFSGYTPYPTIEDDTRLPHFSDKLTRQIHKTALGAETEVPFKKFDTLLEIITDLKSHDYTLIALEQSQDSISPKECVALLREKYNSSDIALFVGNEIHGVKEDILKQMDIIMEIPMVGKKESLNVSVATAIALYELTAI